MLAVYPFDIESKLSGTGAVAPLFDVGLELSPPELLVGEPITGPIPSPTVCRLGDIFFRFFGVEASGVSNGDRDRPIPKPDTESV
jgi:hypothetical protein